MEKRLIKKNGDKISVIGLGTMRLATKNGNIDKDTAKRYIYYGIDSGINFIDTGFLYHGGKSESFLGEILQGEYRSKVKISTKLPSWSIRKREDMDNILNEQLKALKTDYIDYYFLHSVSLDTVKRLAKKGVFEFLEESKKSGKIINIGFSYHGPKDEFNDLIDLYDWDMCMVQYNYFDNNVQASYDGIRYAYSKGIGVFVMEPLKGGILAGEMPKDIENIFKSVDKTKTNAEWGLSWIFNHPEITCVLSGVGSLNELKENINIAKKVKPNSLTTLELNTIDDAKNKLKNLLKINCATCGYCMPCPNGVNIPECFKIYNEKSLFNKKNFFISQSFIDYSMILGGTINLPAYAGLCDGCGKCLRKCPQNLNIPKELEKVSKEFEFPFFKSFMIFIRRFVLILHNKIMSLRH